MSGLPMVWDPSHSPPSSHRLKIAAIALFLLLLLALGGPFVALSIAGCMAGVALGLWR